ncbi:hypothetical protein FAIPA1_300047 [Frankia sp. AiPs1]|uniref:hypothetical protein n=1 Tax=Frankia sp. AiPa1 TaxID=573492 RepID=UPI00202B8457|nr:hypothetical protein [Frankia sp. AiPa1]MCL9761617.1 hypothetical protein [Frankia sp. AiPa1]
MLVTRRALAGRSTVRYKLFLAALPLLAVGILILALEWFSGLGPTVPTASGHAHQPPILGPLTTLFALLLTLAAGSGQKET